VGRLSFPWPRTAMPVTYDDEDRTRGALFARGYGLSYAHAKQVGRLSENPQIPADRGNRDSLFQAGHPTAPWSLFVADKLAQVRATGGEQGSPGGAVRVAVRDSLLTVAWSGASRGDFWIGGRPVDLRTAALRGDAVQARFRIDRPPSGTVKLGVRCGATSQAADTGCALAAGALLDATQALSSVRGGKWATLSLPLVCFSDRGAELTSVAAPFAIRSESELGISFATIRLVRAGIGQCGAGVQVK